MHIHIKNVCGQEIRSFKITYAHQDYIYLIKKHSNTLILWNIIAI